MAAPIRIGTLDAAEASDLAQALAARGLVGRPLGKGSRRWVEVREAREETNRLLADVMAAVETWLAEHDRPALELRCEDRVHRIASSAHLHDALRARIRARTRTDPKPRT